MGYLQRVWGNSKSWGLTTAMNGTVLALATRRGRQAGEVCFLIQKMGLILQALPLTTSHWHQE